MYREMGSVFLGTYVRHDIVPISHRADSDLAFDRDQVILRIRCFMKQRDDSVKTDVSFYHQESRNFRLKACKSVKLKKTFAPPYGVKADAAGTFEAKPVQFQAGIQISETDESYTLWMVRGSSASVNLRNQYVPSLYHHTC